MRRPFAGWAATADRVLDNLREGVLSPDIYDPGLNPLYRDVLAHYGVTALPCRVRDPDRKGKVESGVNHAQMTPLKGKKFESLEEAQAYLDHWEERWADKRIHGGPSGRSRRCSPKRSPFCKRCRWSRSATTSTASAPFTWMAVSRLMRLTTVRRRAGSGGRSTCNGTRCTCDFSIRAPASCCASIWGRSVAGIASAMRTVRKRTPLHTHQLLARAHKAGVSIGAVCDAIHHRQARPASAASMGMLSLAKKYGCAACDQACAAALELGVSEYQFVRRYLERSQQAPLSLRQVDPLIRELTQYRDLIQQRIQFEESQS
jgi:hypothetical protein